MASISGLLSQTSSYESFVTQLVQIESQKKFRMQFEKLDRTEEKKALGSVSSAITSLENIIEELETPTNKSFQPFSTSSTDDSVVTVNSATGIDDPSTFNITVDRLASKDTALSQVKTGSDTDLAAFGDGSIDVTIGDTTETITVATTKDDGSGGTVDMTNEEIFTSFTDQIESLFGEQAKASVFQVNDTDVQFSVQSLTTGFDNRIQLSNATGVMSEISSNVTHLTPEAELDASFTVDGITFERSENTIDDAISGLSFTLKKATGQQEQMSVERDIESAVSNVEDFVSAFNDLNSNIRKKTFINPDTGNKGPLQGMRSIRNLSLNLRQTAMLEFSGAASGEVSRLSDMGITFDNDGTMKIEDKDLLEEILADRPEEVEAFFETADSPIAQMKARAVSYTESEGILSALEDGVEQKLDRLDKSIEREEKYLADYEAKQREIFNQLDLLLEQGQAQFDQVANFIS
ncbi:MAG: hypothetical protein FH748_00630 [Balneolaceae bacterium]|nr:hypothetical protein [Balneolaceae bacterium]